MSPHVHVLRASPPWGDGCSPETDSDRDQAPREDAAYTCENPRCRRKHFTVPFAAGAAPPLAFRCRCGSAAALDAAGPGPGLDAAMADMRDGAGEPGYTIPGRHAIHGLGKGTSEWEQLCKRRTRKQGEAILAEAMERARAGGYAR